MRLIKLGLGLTLGALAIAGCDNKKSGGDTPAGSASATSTTVATKSWHCTKKDLARCEQATAEGLAAAKAKMESGNDMEKKMAGFMTESGFKMLCDKGEFGDGPCPTADVAGACTGAGTKMLYYSGGANGYKPEDVAFECKDSQTPEGADGKPIAKPAAKRMSCFRKKSSTCVEDTYKGKSSLIGFCTDSPFDGPGEQKMEPCPAEKRVGSCADKPFTFEGKTLEATRVTYVYDAKAAATKKSTCEIMKGTWTKL